MDEWDDGPSTIHNLPTWGALALGFVVAVAVGTLAVAFYLALHKEKPNWMSWSCVEVVTIAPFFLPFICGTFVFAVFAPMRRWDLGILLGGWLFEVAFGLLFYQFAQVGGPFLWVFLLVLAPSAAGSYAGLALAPPWSKGALLRSLLAILSAVVVVALLVRWDSPDARQHRQKRVDLGCYPVSRMFTCLISGGNCCTWLKWRKET